MAEDDLRTRSLRSVHSVRSVRSVGSVGSVSVGSVWSGRSGRSGWSGLGSRLRSAGRSGSAGVRPVTDGGAERGSGTVLMVVLVMAAGFLITVTLALAGAIVARHRAGAIADLSALAAASGPPGPGACEQAQQVAAANGGQLRDCRVLGDASVFVKVGLAGSGLSLLGVVEGTARAGQAPSSDGP
jgi:secretion/DNA translocation related TadE-like protein